MSPRTNSTAARGRHKRWTGRKGQPIHPQSNDYPPQSYNGPGLSGQNSSVAGPSSFGGLGVDSASSLQESERSELLPDDRVMLR